MPTATEWVRRWDAQQETTMPDREERFEVIVDLIEAVAGPTPRVLDVGCGPGSLAARVLARLPGAEVVGVDADPVLLSLARSTAPAGVTLAEVDLRDPGWTRALPTGGRYDVVASTTALHWLRESELRSVYAACHRLLRPGGLLINGDHLAAASPRLTALATELDSRRARRHQESAGLAGPAGEQWEEWWQAVGAEPQLAAAVEERRRRRFDHPEHAAPGWTVHEQALRAAGFAEVEVLWRKGTDAVVAALSNPDALAGWAGGTA